MIDSIKHILGLCGEPHLNLFSVALIVMLCIYAIYKYKLKQIK